MAFIGPRLRALTVAEVVVSVVIILVLLSFAANIHTARHHAFLINDCQAKLKTLGQAMTSYSVDHQYFPHMRPHDQEHNEVDISRVYRTLIHSGLVESKEVICVSSTNIAVDLAQKAPKTVKEPRLFSWTRDAASNKSLKRPVLQTLASDSSVFANPFLSYTYRRKSLAKNAAKGEFLAADKIGIMSFGPDKFIEGNHVDFVNALRGDLSVQQVEVEEQKLIGRLNEALHMNGWGQKK